MSRYSNALSDVFAAHGADAESGLAAYANTDPQGWSSYIDDAAVMRYRSDQANWARSLVRSVERERITSATGQARLFEPGETDAHIKVRERLRLDGIDHDLGPLAGKEGVDVIRKVAERDLSPALTTVNRCRTLLRLADHMDAESERLGRPVTAGEVLGWAA